MALTQILQAALATIAQVDSNSLAQHWNGDGPNGKINSAVQILKEAAAIGGTLEQNLAKSPAAQNPHPDIATHAANLTPEAASPAAAPPGATS